jgi:hypothetical protein
MRLTLALALFSFRACVIQDLSAVKPYQDWVFRNSIHPETISIRWVASCIPAMPPLSSMAYPFGDFHLSYQPFSVSDEKTQEFWIDVRYWAEEPGTLQNGILYYAHPGGEVRNPLPMPQIVKTEPFYQQSGWGAASTVYLAGTHYTIRVPLTLDDMTKIATAGELILRYPRFTSTPLEFRITNMAGFRGFLMPTEAPIPPK